jgi:demethoxyubiquinone hydroxylase (CLK1/Coq7/Cat5 family)
MAETKTRVRRPLEERLKEAQDKAKKLRAKAKEKESKAMMHVVAAIFELAEFDLTEDMVDDIIKTKGKAAKEIAKKVLGK